MRAEGVDVYITNKSCDGKTLQQLAELPQTRGVFARRIRRGAISVDIPILPKTVVHRGDIISLVGRVEDTHAAAEFLGYADRATRVADVTFIGVAITLGATIGSITIELGSIPLTSAAGTLIAGLLLGWLRSVHPTFGRIPDSTLWFMNTVGD